MKYTVADATDRAEWNRFITAHPEANFLQSWSFYEFHLARDKQIVRRLFWDDQKNLIAAYAGVVETARRGKHLAIAGGPILDWKKHSLVKTVFTDIKEQGIKHGCTFVRVRPQLELSDSSLTLFQKLGLKKAPLYLSVEYAGILDLNKTEEEILANASQGFRRKLRKAEKNQITIEKSTNPTDIKKFYEIQLATAKRHHFVAFSEDFLTKQFSAFAKNDEAVLYIAKKDGQILAENFMIFYGNEVSYHYGVSSELGTKLSSAPLLHMEAMRDARKRDIKRYNLWGIVAPNDTKHRFYGVSEFKRSFGCDELKYTPAHDLILRPTKYALTKIIETTRKHQRHV